ncbi:MAG: hypothetical protein KJ930_13090, partial [Gammaproteobacteria bacterium]|nr:hypothetical protein [Gammaproteobacteria bacterium]
MPSKPLLIGVGLTLSLALFFSLLPTPTTVETPASIQHATSKEVSTTSADAASFVLGPVELFDGDHWQGQRYVEVRQGRITQMSERPLRNELQQIEGGGRSLLPGLIDAHVHTYNDALEQTAQYGVTTVFDMFMSAPLMKQFQAGRE